MDTERRHYAYVGMANINGKLHLWNGIGYTSSCGRSLDPYTCQELDITDRGRDEQYGALCRRCWPTLSWKEDE